MGYVRKTPVIKLMFDDEEYEGLEIRMESMPLGEFLEIDKLSQDDGHDAFRKMIEQLASHLRDWNLEEENGTPVPANLEGLKKQDLVFVRAIVNGYRGALFGVGNPLPQKSSNGDQSQEALIPMETLSPSQAS